VEMRAPAKGRAVVPSVYADVLGRNGKHLVVRKGSDWRLTAKGDQWLLLLAK